MSRSHLLAELRSVLRASIAARNHGLPLAEVLRSEHARPTRRQLIGAFGLAAGAALSTRGSFARGATQPRVAIVGGGIAGLHAALTLLDAGIVSTIYEAGGVVGGRIHSNTTAWLEGQTSEWCGELIDSNHRTMLRLAKRFGLTVVDLIAAQPPGSTDTLYFFEKYYGVEQAYRDFQVIAAQLEFDANRLFPTTYNPATHFPRAVELDRMSARQWIDLYVPGGHRSPLGAYIDSAYTSEFGLNTDRQSSLNIVYSMGFQTDPAVFSIYGQSDERYHVLGGNDQIPLNIAAALNPENIRTGWWMESIRKSPGGVFELTFSTPDGVRSVTADHVILTLPFSVLRGLDYQHAGFDALKQTAIQELGYGTNSKLVLQFSERLWDRQGPWGLGDGNMYTDLFFQNTWDSSRGIPGNAGVLAVYAGGTDGLSFGGAAQPFATAATSPQVVGYAERFLNAAKLPWPGIQSLWNGHATLSTPWKAPNLLGSYSCWLVGQYTGFSGYEGVRQGNCHFAGEHCSVNFQGFMEGGAETGARAAAEIISDLSA